MELVPFSPPFVFPTTRALFERLAQITSTSRWHSPATVIARYTRKRDTTSESSCFHINFTLTRSTTNLLQFKRQVVFVYAFSIERNRWVLTVHAECLLSNIHKQKKRSERRAEVGRGRGKFRRVLKEIEDRARARGSISVARCPGRAEENPSRRKRNLVEVGRKGSARRVSEEGQR